LGLAFVPSFLFVAPFISFGRGMFTLLHCILEVCKFLFEFTRVHS
jgi:hypothetical protein